MLTPRQNDALVFLRAQQQSTGRGVSYAELAAGIGLKSKSGVHRLVNGLEERGLITRLRRRSRSLRVVDVNPLAHYTSASLREELRRRGEGHHATEGCACSLAS
jgi:repressor LexA